MRFPETITPAYLELQLTSAVKWLTGYLSIAHLDLWTTLQYCASDIINSSPIGWNELSALIHNSAQEIVDQHISTDIRHIANIIISYVNQYSKDTYDKHMIFGDIFVKHGGTYDYNDLSHIFDTHLGIILNEDDMRWDAVLDSLPLYDALQEIVGKYIDNTSMSSFAMSLLNEIMIIQDTELDSKWKIISLTTSLVDLNGRDQNDCNTIVRSLRIRITELFWDHNIIHGELMMILSSATTIDDILGGIVGQIDFQEWRINHHIIRATMIQVLHELDHEQVWPHTRVHEDLWLDSLDVAELYVRTQQYLGGVNNHSMLDDQDTSGLTIAQLATLMDVYLLRDENNKVFINANASQE